MFLHFYILCAKNNLKKSSNIFKFLDFLNKKFLDANTSENP